MPLKYHASCLSPGHLQLLANLASLDMQVELGRLVLKRFLLLVLLLDRAAMSDKIPHSAPLLLRPDGVCKKSEQVKLLPNGLH